MLKQKWPELTGELSLRDALGSLTLEQMKRIGALLQIGGLSGKNKTALAEHLADKMPDHLWNTVQFWDMHRWEVVRKAIKGKGVAYGPLLDMSQLDYFMERGVLFPRMIDGRFAHVMPAELLPCFEGPKDGMNEQLVRRNTEWIKLVRGMLYYYGTLSFDEVDERLASVAVMPGIGFWDTILDALHYGDEIDWVEGERLTDYRVEDSESIRREQASRLGLGFYPFTKAQLLAAGEKDFVDRTKPYRELVQFLLSNFDFEDREEADFLVDFCADIARSGGQLHECVQYMLESIQIDDGRLLDQLTGYVVNLMNGTRQYVIKGYSPDELSAARNKNATIAPMSKASNGGGTVVSIATKQKVGRNDPCPCGSGKKFKKCHGSE